MYKQAQQFFKSNSIDMQNFDYFDYADFFQHLSSQKLLINPTKRKIVSAFLQKCEHKLSQKQKNRGSWQHFLQRMQAQKKYKKQKMQALSYLNQNYDYKSNQIYFYPKLNKRHATQPHMYWKDIDDVVSLEQPIEKPNQSTFEE